MNHGYDDQTKNKVEVLSKEETYALLQEAINTGEMPQVDENTAFVTMLKDPITGTSHKVAFVTQAKYNELESLGQLIPNAYYFIIDDTTAEDLDDAIEEVDARVDSAESSLAELAGKVSEYGNAQGMVRIASLGSDFVDISTIPEMAGIGLYLLIGNNVDAEFYANGKLGSQSMLYEFTMAIGFKDGNTIAMRGIESSTQLVSLNQFKNCNIYKLL